MSNIKKMNNNYSIIKKQLEILKDFKSAAVLLFFVFIITAGAIQVCTLLKISLYYLPYFSFQQLAKDALLLLLFYLLILTMILGGAMFIDFVVSLYRRNFKISPFKITLLLTSWGLIIVQLSIIFQFYSWLGLLIFLMAYLFLIIVAYLIFFEEKLVEDWWRVGVLVLYLSSVLLLVCVKHFSTHSARFLMSGEKEVLIEFVYHNGEYVFARSKAEPLKTCVAPFSNEFLETGYVSEACQRYLIK